MRPHENPPKKRGADRAARTYLIQHLGWLDGYPAVAVGADGGRKIEWRLAGLPLRTQMVDRETIRSSSHGVRRAMARFPRALPRVVGDVEAWRAGVDARLELLKPVLHDGAELPDGDALLAAKIPLSLHRPAQAERVLAGKGW